MPSGLMLEVQGPRREFLVPFRKEFVVEVDGAARRLVVELADGDGGAVGRENRGKLGNDWGMLKINVVTLFPEALEPMLGASIMGRAGGAGLVTYRLVQLRDFAHDRHHTVDDYAFGGGAGMVLKPEPFFEAVESLGAGAEGRWSAVRAGRAVRPPAGGALLAGAGADPALRPLQGCGPAGGRTGSAPKKSRWATSC